jgi:cation diffusion facilitator CzcD-associated flavoprotein CzcO
LNSVPARSFDVVVIGAGFGGLYALYELRRRGWSVHSFESGDGPGGTWYWNRYPGARVDIESMIYSYSFDEDLQQEWQWPEHFSPQPDLERYANHVADRFDLRRDITFGTSVTALTYDDASARWRVDTDTGEQATASFVVAATGSLHAVNWAPLRGLGLFEGQQVHTARWPADGVDLDGKHVAVVGTGSTGIQVIPVVAAEAGHLVVLQRTANFSLPSRNRQMDSAYEQEWKTQYAERRRMMQRTATMAELMGMQTRSIWSVTEEERERILEDAWNSRSGFRFSGSFAETRFDLAANDIVAEFIRGKIRQIVDDPITAEKLCPKGYPLGTKRTCLDTGYYETFNLPHVDLVDLRSEPIETVLPHGLRTSDREFDLDVIIHATGFDAMSGALNRIDVRGRGGRTLIEHWAEGPRTHLGMVAAGFPNLFMIHGPGSPSVLAQMIMAGEWQVNWISDLLDVMRDSSRNTVDTTLAAEELWACEVHDAAQKTLYPMADSWYVGANIEGKPRVFSIYVGGFDRYVDLCEAARTDDYAGFVLT